MTQKARDRHAPALTAAEQDKIARLVTDLPAVWDDPATPVRERKRITRLLVTNVTVTRTSDTITAHVRLAGGQNRTLDLDMPKTGPEARKTPPGALAAVDELLGRHTTGEIADILNQRGLASGTGEPFHRRLIDHIIRAHRIPPAGPGSVTRECSPSPRSQPPTKSTGRRSRRGDAPELSVPRGMTTKASTSTTRPTRTTRRPDRK